MKFAVLIPARFASQRLPGKPLLEIDGMPMIEHVWLRARQSGADRVMVCTDDARIATTVEGFGGEVTMTSDSHQSGSDRIAEVAEALRFPDDAIVVNLQGDEPAMPPALIRQVAETLHHAPAAEVSTLATPILAIEEYRDPNVVKVVVDRSGRAMYFSRAPVPWQRDDVSTGATAVTAFRESLRHIGLYAYRVRALRELSRLPAVAIEQVEKLEQLRALWIGMPIQVAIATVVPGRSVDTAADLEFLRRAKGAQ